MKGSTPPKGKGRLLTVSETCARIGYSRQTLYNAVWSGEGELAALPYYRVGRSIRFAEEDIEQFLARHRVEGAR